jgi:hypothetical protein
MFSLLTTSIQLPAQHKKSETKFPDLSGRKAVAGKEISFLTGQWTLQQNLTTFYLEQLLILVPNFYFLQKK